MIQIDMEMPKNCEYCPLVRHYQNGNVWCNGKNLLMYNTKTTIPRANRPDWCPLIDVPDIHFGNISEFSNSSTDCISRQTVIEINRSYHGKMPNEVNHRIWKEINELPSVQPEPCEDAVSDLIERQAARRLNDLIFDINPAEICSQIRSDNLRNWCKTIQTEMKMAMVQLPCWAERKSDG